MPTRISLTEADIRSIVDDGSWTRGRSYYRSGRLIHPQRQGNVLRGESVGSAMRPYRVEATITKNGVQGTSCTCPIGGSCKHVVALLLAFVHQPESFLETSSVGEALKEVDRAGLVTLIERMVEMHPDLQQLVNLPRPGKKRDKSSAPRISEAEMRRQVSAALPGDSYYDYDFDLRQIDNLVRLGDQYVEAGAVDNAAVVYRAVALELIEQYEMLGDESGEVGEIVDAGVVGLSRCLDVSGDASEREAILSTLFDIYKDNLDSGYDISQEIDGVLKEKPSAAEKALVATWGRGALKSYGRGDDWMHKYRREAWGNLLLALERDSMDDERYLQICRETGRTIDLATKLLALGRVDEAVQAAKSTSGYELLQIANLLRQHGHDDRAVALVQARASGVDDRRLQAWLRDYAEEQGDWGVVLGFQQRIFDQRPSFDAYLSLRKAASRAEQWETLQPRVLQKLEEKRELGLLIQIYLAEADIQAALRTLRQMSEPRPVGGPFYSTHHYALQVARAAAETHPREAVELYADAAAREINQRQRSHYATAATYLRSIRDICRAHGDEALWTGMIGAIRSEHERLRALQDELNKAGL